MEGLECHTGNLSFLHKQFNDTIQAGTQPNESGAGGECDWAGYRDRGKGEVQVGWSGPRHILPKLHQGDGEKGSTIIMKNKHQHSLGMAYVPGIMLCYLHDFI